MVYPPNISDESSSASSAASASTPEKQNVDLVENVDSTRAPYYVDPSDESRHTYLGMKGKILHNAISIMAGMGFLLFGYDQGVMGSLLTLPTFTGQFKDMDISTPKLKRKNSTWQGFVVAVYEIGCLAGALFVMWFGDKFGRRKTIFVGCIIMIIGAIIQTASYSSGQLVAARIITGIGNGMNTSTVPVWQSECARPERRGKLVMVEGSLISCGIMISYWIDFAFYFIKHSSISWRFPIAFQILFPLVIVPFILLLPESPRWLIKVGKTEEAVRVFSALEDTPVNDPYVKSQIVEISESLEEERRATGGRVSLRRALKLLTTQGKQKNFHRTVLAFCNQMFQQISGINLITYYAGTIFETYIHMGQFNSRILAACNGTEYFLASWVAFWTVERFGRRKLMLFGAAGQAITMAILTGTVWASDNKDNKAAAIAAAVFLFVFNTFFAIGWLGMTWLYPAEITPLSIRAPATGLSTSSNWIFNFMVVMIAPVAFDNIGPYTYTIFAAINALMVPAVYFFFPETSGRSLEEMDLIFEQSNAWTPWDVVGIARTMPRSSRQLNVEEGKLEGPLEQES